MKSVGQGSLARENKFQLFCEKEFLNPLQIIPVLRKCHSSNSPSLFFPEVALCCSGRAMVESLRSGVVVLPQREKTFLKMYNASMAYNTTI